MPLIQYLKWKWANLLNRMDDRIRLRQVQELDHLRNENQICKRKLDSKCEALLILTKELDGCRRERDQLRLIIEQQRYRQGNAKMFIPTSPTRHSIDHVMRSQALQVEVDDLKQKLRDADGDIKLLREQIARQRMGTSEEGMNMRHFPAHEREELVNKLEDMQEKVVVAERDVQQVLDEKEDLETERDAFKTKYERLNRELNYILKGDENRILDIDAMSMENKYLQERLKQMEEEKCIAMATVTKYKSLLERKKTKGILKTGSVTGNKAPGGLIVSHRQVHEVLEQAAQMPPTMKTVMDLIALSRGLLDSINDKNLALSHQRKTNKILGNRVAELEKKLRTLEVGGLWNVTELSASFDRLRSELMNGAFEENRDSAVSGYNNDDHDGDGGGGGDDVPSGGIHEDPPGMKTFDVQNTGSHQPSEDSMSNLGTSGLSSLNSSPSHEPCLSPGVTEPPCDTTVSGTESPFNTTNTLAEPPLNTTVTVVEPPRDTANPVAESPCSITAAMTALTCSTAADVGNGDVSDERQEFHGIEQTKEQTSLLSIRLKSDPGHSSSSIAECADGESTGVSEKKVIQKSMGGKFDQNGHRGDFTEKTSLLSSSSTCEQVYRNVCSGMLQGEIQAPTHMKTSQRQPEIHGHVKDKLDTDTAAKLISNNQGINGGEEVEGEEEDEDEDPSSGLLHQGYMPVCQEDFQEGDSYQDSDEVRDDEDEDEDYDGDADISDSDLHLQVSPPGDSDVQALSAELHGLIEAIRTKVQDPLPLEELDNEEEEEESQETQTPLYHRQDRRLSDRAGPSEC